MSLKDKTIVVTGACSGIGAETVRVLRARGARVIGLDRSDPMLTLDGFVKADLSEQAAIDHAMKQLPAQVDALANVAGVPGTAPAELLGRVNYLSLRHLSERVAERMSAGASIVNVSSILGHFYMQRLDQHKALADTRSFEAGLAWLARNPVSQATCYEFFKEALIVWTMRRGHALFLEQGIRMNAVAPGPVFTPILGEFATQLGEARVQADASRVKRPSFADEVAPAIAFLCSDDARAIVGANLPVDGGFEASYL
ncbi:coniferyl-alcohol dehydrogenase [Ideonella azotifigens]|uniref:Coniferyl-alcohol dehydrogenase n=1 Tax=Ideonella azotifigens TaxID=513160 RepID=A0ABP3UWL1_9BURK|nr:coniferyl-alcohol dehydrogenase [Ideonella azotifigens]MCD2342014.1 coniferyl-alcohol dehydrogenase [Ideonella azotifigens]